MVFYLSLDIWISAISNGVIHPIHSYNFILKTRLFHILHLSFTVLYKLVATAIMSKPKEQSLFSNNVNLETDNLVISASNPFLTQTNPHSIRAFLKEYDQYLQKIIVRAEQLQSAEGTSTTTNFPCSLSIVSTRSNLSRA